jgi:hypothetical protein
MSKHERRPIDQTVSKKRATIKDNRKTLVEIDLSRSLSPDAPVPSDESLKKGLIAELREVNSTPRNHGRNSKGW